MLKISKPFRNCTPQSLTQGFSQSHQAVDFAGKYGEFLVAICNSKILNTITAENIESTGEELRRGYGIRLQSVENPAVSYTYWHCLAFFPVKIGDTVLQGQPVAQMGNSGFVLSNGKYVEIDIRTIPPYPGTHLHWSMGTNNSDGTYTPLDPSKLIDWSIEIKYSIIDTIKAFLQSISNFLKGR